MIKTLELSDFVVTEDNQENIVQSPTFLTDRFGQAIYDKYQQQRDSTYGNNPSLSLKLIDGNIVYSNFFDVILVNPIIREAQGKPRTALPVDLSNPKILQMIKRGHYVDSQALVLRTIEDPDNERNEPLARALAKYVNITKLKRKPALMHGFNLQLWPEDKKGYSLIVVPNDEFSVHYDDRLLGKWDGYKFDEVDKIGLPKNLDKRKGSRVWYTRPNGISRLHLRENSDLSSKWRGLDSSYSGGRIVVLSGKVSHTKK